MEESNTIIEVRIYTGNGYEDFCVGQVIKSDHIFNKNGLRKELTVKEIYIKDDIVHVVFDECLGFIYRGLKYRESYEYVI